MNIENIQESFVDGIKHLVLKSLTVGATYLISKDVLSVAIPFFTGALPDTLPMQVLLLGTAYTIWTMAVIPFINGFFLKAGTATKGETKLIQFSKLL